MYHTYDLNYSALLVITIRLFCILDTIKKRVQPQIRNYAPI